MWNKTNAHLLGTNFNLCNKLLSSNVNKLRNKTERIGKVDDVICDEVSKGVLELIPDLGNFIEQDPHALQFFGAHANI